MNLFLPLPFLASPPPFNRVTTGESKRQRALDSAAIVCGSPAYSRVKSSSCVSSSSNTSTWRHEGSGHVHSASAGIPSTSPSSSHAPASYIRNTCRHAHGSHTTWPHAPNVSGHLGSSIPHATQLTLLVFSSRRSSAAAGQCLNQCPSPPHPLHLSVAFGVVRDSRSGASGFFGRSQSFAQCPVSPHRLHASVGAGVRWFRHTACVAATVRRRMCAATMTSHAACGERRPARNVRAVRDKASSSSSSSSLSCSPPKRVNGAAPARRIMFMQASLRRSAARWSSGIRSPLGQRMIRSNHSGGVTPSSRRMALSLTSPNLGIALALRPSSRSCISSSVGGRRFTSRPFRMRTCAWRRAFWRRFSRPMGTRGRRPPGARGE